MKLAELIKGKSPEIVKIRANSTIAEAANTIAQHKIGALLVDDEGGAIVGILSERDIVRAVAHDGGTALKRKARDYMTEKVITCGLHDTINDLMQKMSGGRFRHLPIVEDGKLVGIISIGDVVKRRIAEIEQEADSIREYIATA
jgi:CBS domain-containing protein